MMSALLTVTKLIMMELLGLKFWKIMIVLQPVVLIAAAIYGPFRIIKKWEA